MSEYWKSTPNYWCKFCSQYVRETPLERKNHEASAKHQNNIQRSLRNLHKTKEREDRETQRAKDEVARLNGLVSGKGTGADGRGGKVSGASSGSSIAATAAAPPPLSAAAQRKAHAEQLAAMGMKLPDELQRELMGVGSWQTVSERVVDRDAPAGGRSLANIKAEAEAEAKPEMGQSRGVHKRPANDEGEEPPDEATAPNRRIWGTSLKTYPGAQTGEDGEADLDALLNGVVKKSTDTKKEDGNTEVEVEHVQQSNESVKAEGTSNGEEKKLEDVPPPVVFKKRKTKK